MKHTKNLVLTNDLTIHLSDHFTLHEMVSSGTALRFGIDNTPTPEVVENLRFLCRAVLEPLRLRYGRIIITSGYRCREVNRLVGGAPYSQHLRGEAADIYIPSREKAKKYFEFIRDNTDFDQLIREPITREEKDYPRWLHVSHAVHRPNRHETI